MPYLKQDALNNVTGVLHAPAGTEVRVISELQDSFRYCYSRGRRKAFPGEEK
jgi:hypothetical protein